MTKAKTKSKKKTTESKAKKKTTESKVKKKSSTKKKEKVKIVTVDLEKQVKPLNEEEQKNLVDELNDSIEESKKQKKNTKLTKRQKVFADEYLKDLNGSRAARDTGYSQKNANNVSSVLLANPNISSYVADKMKERAKRTEINQDMVVNELAKIAFSDIRDYAKWSGNHIDFYDSSILDNTAAIQEISSQSTEFGNNMKLKFYSKLTALELLGRHLKLELAQHKTEVNHSGQISFKSLDSMSDEELLAIMDNDECSEEAT